MLYESIPSNPVLAGIPQPTFKKNTIRTYQSILSRLNSQVGEKEFTALTAEEILSFLTTINQGTKQLTKHTRYSQLNAFFKLAVSGFLELERLCWLALIFIQSRTIALIPTFLAWRVSCKATILRSTRGSGAWWMCIFIEPCKVFLIAFNFATPFLRCHPQL